MTEIERIVKLLGSPRTEQLTNPAGWEEVFNNPDCIREFTDDELYQFMGLKLPEGYMQTNIRLLSGHYEVECDVERCNNFINYCLRSNSITGIAIIRCITLNGVNLPYAQFPTFKELIMKLHEVVREARSVK